MVTSEDIKLMLDAQIKVLKAFDLRIRSLETKMVDFKDTLENLEDEIRRKDRE
jgi:hypothetical protein